VDEATGVTPTPTLTAWTADGAMFVIADAAGFLRLFSGATGAVLFSTRVLSPAAVQGGDKFLALSFSGTGSTQVRLRLFFLTCAGRTNPTLHDYRRLIFRALLESRISLL